MKLCDMTSLVDLAQNIRVSKMAMPKALRPVSRPLPAGGPSGPKPIAPKTKGPLPPTPMQMRPSTTTNMNSGQKAQFRRSGGPETRRAMGFGKSLVEMSKADEDGRWIKAGVNDKWMASRGENKAARKQGRRDGLKGLAAGTAGGAALGAGGLLATRGKIKRSAMKAGATKEGFDGVFGSAKNTAAAGAFYGGTTGGALGGVIGSQMGNQKGAAKWREKEGLPARGAWGKPKN